MRLQVRRVSAAHGRGVRGASQPLRKIFSTNLTNVRDTDHGWYECKIFFLNRPPETPDNGTWILLDVQTPPNFKVRPPDVVYVKVGESVSLPCEANGTPSPAVVWYKVSFEFWSPHASCRRASCRLSVYGSAGALLSLRLICCQSSKFLMQTMFATSGASLFLLIHFPFYNRHKPSPGFMSL